MHTGRMRRYFTHQRSEAVTLLEAKRERERLKEGEGEMDNLRRPLLGEGPLATIAETDAERSGTQ